MIFTNFFFEGSVGLRLGDKHFDLHSFFSINRIAIYPGKGVVALELKSIDEFRDLVHGARSLLLTFESVNHLEFSPGFCKNMSDTVEEIGFKSPEDLDDNWLKSVEQSMPTDHLFIRLSSLEFFRISFASAKASFD